MCTIVARQLEHDGAHDGAPRVGDLLGDEGHAGRALAVERGVGGLQGAGGWAEPQEEGKYVAPRKKSARLSETKTVSSSQKHVRVHPIARSEGELAFGGTAAQVRELHGHSLCLKRP